MDTRLVFLFQFSMALLAWLTIAMRLVAPSIRSLPRCRTIGIWLAPQVFRVLGAGLLVPALSPGMPSEFAWATAIGDSITALLAITALWVLSRNEKAGIWFAWIVTGVGGLDLAAALIHAATIGAAEFLAGQWYVATIGVPLMIASHLMTLRALRRGPEVPKELSAKGFGIPTQA